MNRISYYRKPRVFKVFRSATARLRTYLFGNIPWMGVIRSRVHTRCYPLISDLPSPIRPLQRVASLFGMGFGSCRFQKKSSISCGEQQMSHCLPNLICLHGTYSLKMSAVSVKNTPKILSIIYGCVTGSNMFGSQILSLAFLDQKFLEALAI